MREKTEEMERVEVQGIEMIDLGDATLETKQPSPIHQVPDTCCSWTYFGE